MITGRSVWASGFIIKPQPHERRFSVEKGTFPVPFCIVLGAAAEGGGKWGRKTIYFLLTQPAHVHISDIRSVRRARIIRKAIFC